MWRSPRPELPVTSGRAILVTGAAGYFEQAEPKEGRPTEHLSRRERRREDVLEVHVGASEGNAGRVGSAQVLSYAPRLNEVMVWPKEALARKL